MISSTKITQVIQNGTVIDTVHEQELANTDVGIKNGKVVAIGPSLSFQSSTKIIDATDQYVCPGLIDLHTHVYWGSTYWGIEADPLAATTGVTTWVDAGSAGAYTFPGFRRHIIERSKVKIFSLLHVSALGLTGRTYELTHDEMVDVDMGVATINQHRSLIKGIKVRMDRDATNNTGLRGIERARRMADAIDGGVPLMIHIGLAPPSLQDLLPYLKKGDILTHCCTGLSNRLVDHQGELLPVYYQLKEKGIVLDLGHGSGSFNFISAEAMLSHQVLPDVISSDLHQISRSVNVYDLPTTLSKYLNMGVSLPTVIAKATVAPAKLINEPQLGVLKLGCPADIACFKLEKGTFIFKDAANNERHATQRLVNTLTMVDGVILEPSKESPPHPWVLRDLATVAALDEKEESCC
ncbi:amidohydrolase [Halteromyces radiatus]|uniref:amidohydrolase n=1 Tax=Halteromyces radiatus TaxID=101107 RepID=UPI00221EC44C|nr:amidohydrolase [Halteromyces radiatus]KAI8082994.1 amidohydrolase [Halteromyces radiatus]